MANLPTYYNAGTASIANGDTAVTGQGTTWLSSGVQPGDLFWAAGIPVRIAAVNSNLSLTLAYAWPGATRTTQSYEVQFAPDMTRVTAANLALLEKLGASALTALGTLTPAADKIGYFDGAGTAALADFKTTGRSLVGAASAPAAYDVVRSRGADIASSATLNLDAATGSMVTVTGNTSITAVTLAAGKERLAYFTGYLSIARTATLVVTNSNGAASPIVPGDHVLFVGLAGGVVRGIHLPQETHPPLVNALGDSGRFTTTANSSQLLGSFAVPAYLSAYDGATLTSEGKFINDNTDYGGSGGSLNGNVKALIDKIRSGTTARRYGIEFFVGRLTAGSGTSLPIVVNGTTYYLSILSGRPILPYFTTHMYVRALTDTCVIPATFFGFGTVRHAIDGVPAPAGPVEITTAMGWVSVESQWQYGGDTRSYDATFAVLRKSAGDAILIALPAIMPGLVRVNPKAGLIPNAQAYPA